MNSKTRKILVWVGVGAIAALSFVLLYVFVVNKPSNKPLITPTITTPQNNDAEPAEKPADTPAEEPKPDTTAAKEVSTKMQGKSMIKSDSADAPADVKDLATRALTNAINEFSALPQANETTPDFERLTNKYFMGYPRYAAVVYNLVADHKGSLDQTSVRVFNYKDADEGLHQVYFEIINEKGVHYGFDGYFDAKTGTTKLCDMAVIK